MFSDIYTVWPKWTAYKICCQHFAKTLSILSQLKKSFTTGWRTKFTTKVTKHFPPHFT